MSLRLLGAPAAAAGPRTTRRHPTPPELGGGLRSAYRPGVPCARRSATAACAALPLTIAAYAVLRTAVLYCSAAQPCAQRTFHDFFLFYCLEARDAPFHTQNSTRNTMRAARTRVKVGRSAHFRRQPGRQPACMHCMHCMHKKSPNRRPVGAINMRRKDMVHACCSLSWYHVPS